MAKIILPQIQKNRIEDYVRNTKDEQNENRISQIKIILNRFAFDVNVLLRAGVMTPELNSMLIEFDMAFDNYRIEDSMLVYRFFNYKEMYRYITDDNKKYLEKGYMSTSTEIDVANGFFENPQIGYYPALLKIYFPKDSQILLVDKIDGFDNNTYENEVLVKRNALYNIITNNEVDTSELLRDNLITKDVKFVYSKIRYIELEFDRYLPL